MTGRSSLSKVHRKEPQRPDIPFIERLGQRHFVIEDVLSSMTDGDFTPQSHTANHFLPVVYNVSNSEYKTRAAFCADPRCLTT